MGDWPSIDSRDYIVAFELGSAGECPPDFALPSSLAGFDTGIFLPRGGPDWFGRPHDPPRILLLKDAALHIVSHPSTGEPLRRYAMERISSVESGHMLLKGWLRFSGSGFDYTIRYNTRGFPAVYRFMRHFRDRLLGSIQAAETPVVHPSVGLDIKFGNALATELDPGEIVRMQVFEAPREVKSRFWLIPYRRSIAGDLLALTGRRLLWITDRERGFRSRYGTIASYARLDAVWSIGGVGDMLQVELQSGPGWQVPIAPESGLDCERVAEDFAAMVRTSLPYRCGGGRT